MPRDQINIRCGHEMKMYLLDMDNYSDYIRDLVDRDRLDRLDHNLINNKIREHEAEIKQLRALKGSKKVNEDKIHELLAYHAPRYKLQAPNRTEGERFRFIENSILKDLKKAGSTATLHEIDELLINWSD